MLGILFIYWLMMWLSSCGQSPNKPNDHVNNIADNYIDTAALVGRILHLYTLDQQIQFAHTPEENPIEEYLNFVMLNNYEMNRAVYEANGLSGLRKYNSIPSI